MNPVHPDAALPRPLDRGEAFFWFLDRVSSNNFVVLAEGSGPLPETALRHALERARQEHPLLAACIVARDNALFFEPGHGGAVELVVEAAGTDWRATLAAHMVRPFALGEAPLIRAIRLDTCDGWVFALIVHHSIGDGRSASHLLLEVIEHACGVDRPHRPRHRQPRMHEIFPPPLHGPAGEAHAAELKQLRKAEFKETGKPDDFPFCTRTFGPPSPGLASFHIDAATLSRLAGRARRAGSSLNGAIGAAQLVALNAAFGDGRTRLLSQLHAADLRDTLVFPVDHGTPGAYVTMVNTAQSVGDLSSFWRVAHGITHDIRRQLQRGDGHQFFRLLPPPESFPPDAQGIAAFAQMIGYWPLNNMLSNVGRLPEAQLPAPTEIRRVSFALCPNPSLVVFCTASTYRGTLTININRDRNRLEDAVLNRFAADFEATLLAAADLPE